MQAPQLDRGDILKALRLLMSEMKAADEPDAAAVSKVKRNENRHRHR